MLKGSSKYPFPFALPVFILLFLLPALSLPAQRPSAIVSGKVLDENEHTLAGVSIIMLGHESGIISSDSGTFRLRVPAGKAFALLFSYTGYKTFQQNFLLNDREQEQVLIRMEKTNQALPGVTIKDDRDRKEAGLIRINPKDAINIPSPAGGIESLIKVFVGSNNELTSQYS
ncbi:MAG TPA: carboxypeptidase-like regulatory domain-containing protein, partial [Puia sp.]|nr:carboxypeptidase-like regulatory domain-containing protein [Puia sp.]